jgi:hypothetical protein
LLLLFYKRDWIGVRADHHLRQLQFILRDEPSGVRRIAHFPLSASAAIYPILELNDPVGGPKT